jgi:hypothetical protein
MAYRRIYDKKYHLPVSTKQVSFFHTRSSLIHIIIPRKSGLKQSICGIKAGSKEEIKDPILISEVCIKCSKFAIDFTDDDLWLTQEWVEYFNSYVSDIMDKEVNPSNISNKSLYRSLFTRIQNEIQKCNHVYLLYLMRHNLIFSLQCHNCQEIIIPTDCNCEIPYPLDFVDTDGVISNKETFCMICYGFVVNFKDKLI